VEKDNLESDIMLRLENIAADKEYKEHYEAIDNQELDKLVDEVIVVKEGEETLDENAK
jgi:hypothetical protein